MERDISLTSLRTSRRAHSRIHIHCWKSFIPKASSLKDESPSAEALRAESEQDPTLASALTSPAHLTRLVTISDISINMHEEELEDEKIKSAKVRSTVIRQIESIIAASFTALNARNFDVATPPWTCYSKHFRNEPNGPAPNLSTYSDHPNLSNSEVTDLSGMIDFFQTLYDTCPGYQTLVVDMTTTELDLEVGHAAVMVSAESHGIPQGLLRPSVSTFEFRREKREWKCVRNRTLPGIAYVPEG